jgi:hypothetical protein
MFPFACPSYPGALGGEESFLRRQESIFILTADFTDFTDFLPKKRLPSFVIG